MKQAFHILGI